MAFKEWIKRMIKQQQSKKLQHVLSPACSLQEMEHFFKKNDPHQRIALKQYYMTKSTSGLYKKVHEFEEMNVFEYLIRYVNPSLEHPEQCHLLEQKCQFLIQKGTDLHQLGSDGNSLLHLATLHANETILIRLLKEPLTADTIHAKNDRDQTPLSLAIGNTHDHLLLHLLRAGADIEEMDPWGRTPLMRLALGLAPIHTALTVTTNDRYVNSMSILLKAGANIIRIMKVKR